MNDVTRIIGGLFGVLVVCLIFRAAIPPAPPPATKSEVHESELHQKPKAKK